jgi:hypothetical protein
MGSYLELPPPPSDLPNCKSFTFGDRSKLFGLLLDSGLYLIAINTFFGPTVFFFLNNIIIRNQYNNSEIESCNSKEIY